MIRHLAGRAGIPVLIQCSGNCATADFTFAKAANQWNSTFWESPASPEFVRRENDDVSGSSVAAEHTNGAGAAVARGADPRNERHSEHDHYGPYMYLE